MGENEPSIIDSTRSFRTSRLASFLYLNMENHIEHHLYPQVPFYSLPGLHEAIKEQLPEPDPGFWRTNIEALSVAIRRTLGRNTKAWSIRQAPHMITEGGFEKLATRSMK
jgi:fatty acid desaturase